MGGIHFGIEPEISDSNSSNSNYDETRNLATDPHGLTRTNHLPTWPAIHVMPFGQYLEHCYNVRVMKQHILRGATAYNLFGLVSRTDCLCASVWVCGWHIISK